MSLPPRGGPVAAHADSLHMDPLDAALIHAWDTHIVPRLQTPAGRAQLAARLRPIADRAGRDVPAARPLRSFTLVLRANDRRLPDNNTAGAVLLDPEQIEKLCAPIHLPPPGIPRGSVARRLGISTQALTGRVRSGQLLKHQPRPTQRRPARYRPYPGETPTPNIYYHAPPPHHLIDPAGDVQSADWGTLNQNLHTRPRNLPGNLHHPKPSAGDPQPPASPENRIAKPSRNADTSGGGDISGGGGGGWSQVLFRTVRQLRPHNPTPQYERFEWLCPTCPPPPEGQPPDGRPPHLVQRLYWPFRPLTLPAYLGFDFHQLAPELPADQIENLQSKIKHEAKPFTPGFTCRKCLKKQFGGRGLIYESTEFTSHNGKGPAAGGKNTWHLFIQRLTMNLLRGDEVQLPPTALLREPQRHRGASPSLKAPQPARRGRRG